MGLDAHERLQQGLPDRPDQRLPGGIIAFNRAWWTALLREGQQTVCRSADGPDFTAEALEIFKAKANVRLLKIALPSTSSAHGGKTDWERGRNAMDAKRIGSGLLRRRPTTTSCVSSTSRS